MNDRKIKIDKIREGLVIDHIQPGLGGNILHLARKMVNYDPQYSFLVGFGLRSPKRDEKDEQGNLKKEGRKDLVKICGHIEFDPRCFFLVDRGVTVKEIKDYNVSCNHTSTLPETVCSLFKCKNPTCITNNEAIVETIFSRMNHDIYCCQYCKREFSLSELIIRI